MENSYGGIQNSDVATLSLLGRGGYGGGYGYDRGNFAGDGSVVKEGIRGNRDLSLLDSVNQGTRDQFLASQIRMHSDNIADRIGSGQDFLAGKISDQGLEFRFANMTAEHATIERVAIANQQALMAQLNANKADTDRQLHAMELKQVECCCELKAGQATIIANQESHRLAAAESENQNLRTQILINNQGRVNGGQGN